MVKRKYVERTKITKEKVLLNTERFCDICGKSILSHYWRVELMYDADYETKDVCSCACLNHCFEDYMDCSNDSYNSYNLKVEHYNTPNSQ